MRKDLCRAEEDKRLKDCESAIREKVKQPVEKWENENAERGETTRLQPRQPTRDKGNAEDGRKRQ